MRKVVLAMSISLDGFVAGPRGELDWVFPNMDAEVAEWTNQSLSQMDTHVLGRVNYEEQAGYWPSATGDLAPLINKAAKVVFSTTLDRADWQNSRIATRGVAEEIAALRAQPGKDILVPGGARFAQEVSRLRLVDEYRLLIHPVVLGKGLPLFADEIKLKLQSTKTFATGAVALTYTPE